jgi:hypothetical protein
MRHHISAPQLDISLSISRHVRGLAELEGGVAMGIEMAKIFVPLS